VARASGPCWKEDRLSENEFQNLFSANSSENLISRGIFFESVDISSSYRDSGGWETAGDRACHGDAPGFETRPERG
jgi:hypothetical protein